jgi:hypothetical protein
MASPFNVDSLEVQRVLGAILRDPKSGLAEIVDASGPGLSDAERDALAAFARRCLRARAGTSGGGRSGNARGREASAPERDELIDRLEFTWKTLREAERILKEPGLDVTAQQTSVEERSRIFVRVLHLDESAKGPLCASRLHEVFLGPLCEALNLEPNGAYLALYREFLKSSKSSASGRKPKNIGLSLVDSLTGRAHTSNLRRLTWWILRGCKARYFDEGDSEPAATYIPFLVEYARKRTGVNPAPRSSLDLAGEIRREVVAFLERNCLLGDLVPQDPRTRKELTEACAKANSLDQFVWIAPADGSARPSSEDADRLRRERDRAVADARTLADERLRLERELAGLRERLARQHEHDGQERRPVADLDTACEEASEGTAAREQAEARREHGNQSMPAGAPAERLQHERDRAEAEARASAEGRGRLESEVEEVRGQLRQARFEGEEQARRARAELDAARGEAAEARAALQQAEARLADARRELEGRIQHASQTAQASLETTVVRAFRDFLAVIDSKYPLDTLWLLQQGKAEEISLVGLVGQFFLALRKAGLVRYPDHEEFELAYDQSGLYDCQGFDVPPGQSVRVRVDRRGWALRRDRSLLPVRRARVAATPGQPVTS